MILFVVAYLAGVLTIVSPCILPVLPFVFARAGQPFSTSILPMLLAKIVTFAGIASLAALGGNWAVQANAYGRYAAIAMLAVFGVTLLSTRAAAFVTGPLVELGNRLSRKAATGEKGSIGGSILLGVATGLLWAPCAGPVLGLVLTGAALNGANAQTTLLLVAYAAGAATSLALAVLAGARVFAAMKRFLGLGDRIRQGLGVAVLAGVGAIALGLDTGLLAQLSYASTSGVEQSILDRLRSGASPVDVASTRMTLAAKDTRQAAYRSDLPVEGQFPSLDGAVQWLNSKPLTPAELRGKVVLVDFWTYSCINCIRTIPYVRAWAEKYRDQGLVVIGVHAPEFAFEKQIGNVEKAVRDFKITYPVAIDNNFAIWRAFSNSYWPAHYFIDAEGQIRYTHFGEGDYEGSERVIQDLLAEAAGKKKAEGDLVKPEAKGAEASPDLARLGSGETYVGYARAANFVSPEGVSANTSARYTVGKPGLNEWGLTGNWTVGAEEARLNEAGGGITYRFRARDLHLVLGTGTGGRPVPFRITIDGVAPGADHGADIDAAGKGAVSGTRLYQLVRQSGAARERTFEIRFLAPGAEAFVFTFG
ncbi:MULTISPECIES: cytochrome c biogenesis protein DipZ [unclassified Ensifer]|uniref:cytochrome c biogenesis protein DipZ n=1 Tax=unclassified Ensifer TaxID=2633371 RepID=UPI0007123918|nr:MULTISPECIES: cytochrome c biogenesis protein DipZ [unclassified Ensifer]KQX55887.1 cytochrome C biogenesis protein [Ensifer sp. Root1298]KQX91720.1 cytochrome C biogenesis protein [Ensifer sp. Root1312]KRC26712.1 cytochrome C biogenesis protein [Ensifer sp. Root74]KRD71852.1 cytochrome C biogenesis protein [Ensifer sp. Root954]